MSIAAPNEIYAANAARRRGVLQKRRCGPWEGELFVEQGWAVTRIKTSNCCRKSACRRQNPSGYPAAHGDDVEGCLVRHAELDPAKKYPVKFLIQRRAAGALGVDDCELIAGILSCSPANGYVRHHDQFPTGTHRLRAEDSSTPSKTGDWGGAPFEDLMKGLDYAARALWFLLISPGVRAGG